MERQLSIRQGYPLKLLNKKMDYKPLGDIVSDREKRLHSQCSFLFFLTFGSFNHSLSEVN